MVEVIGVATQPNPTAQTTKSLTQKDFETYDLLVNNGVSPADAAKEIGISPTIAAQMEQQRNVKSKEAMLALSIDAEGTATSREKALIANAANTESAAVRAADAKRSLNSLDKLEAANADASVFGKTLGPGIIPTVVRAADRLLSGVVDVGAGEQTDLQNIDAAKISGIAEIAKGWSGAISNFENQLFELGAPGPSKTPEYNRAAFSAALGTAAQVGVFDTMLNEVNALRKGQDPLTPSNALFSANNRRAAMKWIAEQNPSSGIMFDPKMDPYSPEYTTSAQAWSDYANDPANAAQIREAILRASLASEVGGGDLNAKAVSDALGKNKIITPSQAESTATIPTPESLADDAAAQQPIVEAAAAAEQQGAMNAAMADGQQAGQQQNAPPPVNYATSAEALSAVQEALKAGGDVPTSFTVNGKPVTLNRFPDEAAAAGFVDQLKAAGQPIPKLLIIGNSLRSIK
jgi:hypothetical protein